jgi:hypothetical protein
VAVGALLPERGPHTSQIGAPPASAATILDRAARTAMCQPPAVPGKGQFEYVKMLQGLTSSNVPKGLTFGIRFWQTNTLQTCVEGGALPGHGAASRSAGARPAGRRHRT